MPNGFFGNAARRYLTQVTTVHTRAVAAAQKCQEEIPDDMPNNMSSNITGMARMRQLPFTPEDGFTGRATTGRGDSSNIVVDEHEYNEVVRRLCQIDDAIGECIYKTAAEIEELCQTIFVLPSVAPRCQDISHRLKNMLREYAELTAELELKTRSFAREITEIG